MDRLTKKQAVVLSAYTGIMMCRFSDMHEYTEKKFNRPVFTHEFADVAFSERLRSLSRDDFMAIMPEE